MTAQATDKGDLIPAEWLKAVCEALAQEGDRVTITGTAWARWESIFPDTFKPDLYAVLARFLSKGPVVGRRIYGMRPDGEVYAFFFEYKKRTLYGKINLRLPEKRIVLILSAHLPDKGEEL
ncbi:MAG: hypothetical protein PHG96_09985 [Kiritimatiellae bacterium]|nr:hypothetical protein [Kiritimatiellia bacterium]